MKKGATSVDRVAANLERANRAWENAQAALWGPRWRSGGGSVSMAPNPNVRRRLQANINAAQARRTALRNQLRGMNKNALQVQYLKKNDRAFAITRRMGNISRELNRIPRNNYRQRVPLAREFKALKQEQKNVLNNLERLRGAINLRKKVLARRMTRERAEQVVARSLRPLMHKVLYGPYGTRTLNAYRRGPGYTPPTLENLARVMRQLNRTRQALARK